MSIKITMQNNIKIHHIALSVKNINNVIKYFSEFLKFRTISTFKTRKGNQVMYLKKNNFVIELMENKKTKKNKFKHIAFTTDNIMEAARQFKKKGLKFLSEIHSFKDDNNRIIKFCFFNGPEDFILELVQISKCNKN